MKYIEKQIAQCKADIEHIQQYPEEIKGKSMWVNGRTINKTAEQVAEEMINNLNDEIEFYEWLLQLSKKRSK
jgi:hypothetical protein